MPRVQRCPAGHMNRRASYSPSVSRPADPPLHGTMLIDDNDTAFTEQFIKPQLVQVQENDTMDSNTAYSLEAKPTRATLAESFSSGDDDNYNPEYVGVHHAFSSDDNNNNQFVTSFVNLTEETAVGHIGHGRTFDTGSSDGRDDYLSNRFGSSMGSEEENGDFIDLAQEAAQISSRHYRTTTTMHEDEFENYAALYGLEEEEEEEEEEEKVGEQCEDGSVLQFVDSEDGNAFSFRIRPDHTRLTSSMSDESRSVGTDNDPPPQHHQNRTLQQNISLEVNSMGYETCSKTLNTNLETLHTDLEGVNYIPTMHEYDVVHDPAYTIELHGGSGAEGESYDDDENRIGGGVGFGGNIDQNHHSAVSFAIAPNASYMYEDDGYIRHGEDEEQYVHNNNLRKQENFHGTALPYQNDTLTEFSTDKKAKRKDGEENNGVSSQLMDSYLSDRSSTTSWDEGSYASASRNISRLDSFEGTEFTEEHRRGDNGLLMDILKKFRDRRDDDSEYDDGDAEHLTDVDEEDGDVDDKENKARRRSRRRSKRRDLNSVLGRIGAIGMDLLNETLEQAQQGSGSSSSRRSSRRRSSDQAGKIMDSFREIFSCGNPSHY